MKSCLVSAGARRAFGLVSLVLATAACAPATEQPAASAPAEDPAARAARVAQEVLLVDTHVDVPYRLMEKMEDISVRTESGDFDYPRAQAGGLDAPFMSIYVPASYQENGGAKELADQLIDMVEGFATRWPDKFALARSPAQVREVVAQGKVALPLGMENGAPVEDDLANLQHFFDRGIRYITLTHSENNQICDSSYAEERQWNGLSPFGRQVVAEMNRLGIMVDVSHLSDATVDQVLELSKAPVIASHSSARHFTPGWERNLDDDRIRKLAAQGGVIQINFGSAFLREDVQKQSEEFFTARAVHLAELGVERDSEEGRQAVEAFTEAYFKEHQRRFADLADVVAHIDHVVQLVGVDHVGFGSDFDGVGDSLPTGLKDVSQYPNLIRALLEGGYTEEEVAKIAGGNLLRVWEEVERVARELQGG